MNKHASLILLPFLSWLLLRSVLLSGEVSELWIIAAGGEVAIGLEELAELAELAELTGVLCVRGSFEGSGSGFSSMFVSVPSTSAGTLCFTCLVALSEDARVVFHCSVLPSASSVCGTSKRGVTCTCVCVCVGVRVAMVKSVAVGPLAVAPLPAGGLDGAADRAVSCR